MLTGRYQHLLLWVEVNEANGAFVVVDLLCRLVKLLNLVVNVHKKFALQLIHNELLLECDFFVDLLRL